MNKNVVIHKIPGTRENKSEGNPVASDCARLDNYWVV